MIVFVTITNRTTPLCSKTSKVNGVTIPKDMNVMIAFQELHYSTEYWDKPDVFRPERYILIISFIGI